jgi:signal transduction histidine kinase/DNA-binding response OmpR family regulator
MNLNIKGKLLFGYIIILGILIFMAFFMSGKISDSNDRLLNIVNVSAKKVNLSNEIMIAVLEAGRHEKNIILEKNAAQKSYYKDRIYEATAIINKKTSDLDALVDEKGRILLSEFNSTWRNYMGDLNEIIQLAMQNEDEKAFKISIDKGLRVRDASIAALQNVILKNEQSVEADKAENLVAYSQALNLIKVLIAAAVILVIIISFWIIQGITKRIVVITQEAEKIASREFADDKLHDNVKDELSPVFQSLISVNESFREVTENANSVASGNYEIDIMPRSDKDTLGKALKKMTHSLRESTAETEKRNWLSTGYNMLNEKLMGDQSLEDLTSNTINFLCTYLKANIGAVYLFDEGENSLLLYGQHAFLSPKDAKTKFKISEGLVGQAAQGQNQISIKEITDDQMRISSSVLNAKPKHLLITPFVFEGKTLGVTEIGSLKEFSETEKEFIGKAMEIIAVSLNSAVARKKIKELLEETQVQGEELQTQQEELKQMNEELEEQAQNLKQQQEELQMTNEELEEQTQSLELKNKEVEESKRDIEQKTKQLEISSRYKSEFLANMSHELRTPLNSLLILSKDLSENRKNNLSPDQVESAEIIYKSGTDLLVLINEVLDLSKVEAGKMDVNIERISLKTFAAELMRNFKHSADQKGLQLTCTLADDLPESIHSDPQRLNQILKNLLSNAIKFTDKGNVAVSFSSYNDDQVVISISDTGIGIAEDKQMSIFEAFQQADGGTSRKFGGTGLGLSISRELAKLLSAEIKLSSRLNMGSVFSVILPKEIKRQQRPPEAKSPQEPFLYDFRKPKEDKFINYPSIDDDRDSISENDKTLLIIEDDLRFASILLKQANNKEFKCLSAATGEDGLALALKYKPDAIILDLDLPGIKGQQVLNELKANPAVRHIPVHIISVNERSIDTIKDGAIEYLMKPVDKKDLEEAFTRIENFVNRKMRNLLIVEDDENSRKAIIKLIGNGDVKCMEAGTGKEALKIYVENQIDCIVLDLGLPDTNGFDLILELENVKDRKIPPIIIYTGKELTKEEHNKLQSYAESIIIKGVKSEERLLDETALFLHRTIGNLPKSQQVIINNLHDKEAIFLSKKILLVDDDMRNIFALSKILQECGLQVIKAENGKIALEMLEKNKNIDLVLMDIMMPEMDGYEAMKRIRQIGEFKSLPIIALTAKAMKDDKQKCIDAGANDYIAKPIDVDRLLSLMRVWLSK